MTRAMKFLATPEHGKVSALLERPERATHLLVLGHGASTDMRHDTLQSITDRLAEVGIATFRYNFPYSENGRGRDGQAVCTETIRSAVAAAQKAAPNLPLLAGGHSFGGRMTSTAASESPLEGVRGLVFFSFPLHLAGKPETKRADHLASVTVPMLFLAGTRDALADLALLTPVCEGLGDRATLHLLDTADHGYKILKKSRASPEDVFAEMARVVREWAAGLGEEAPTRKKGSAKNVPTPVSAVATSDWRGELLSRLRALILAADPGITEEYKWKKPTNPSGVPTFSHNGLVCTGETYKSVVKLTFAKGASLPDPSNLFNSGLDGKARRAIDLREGDVVDEVALTALVRAAVSLNESSGRFSK